MSRHPSHSAPPTQKNTKKTKDFEFLNGHPGVPGGVWTNSFYKGMSFGEQLFKPPQYQSLCKMDANTNSGTAFIKYGIHWQVCV